MRKVRCTKIRYAGAPVRRAPGVEEARQTIELLRAIRTAVYDEEHRAERERQRAGDDLRDAEPAGRA